MSESDNSEDSVESVDGRKNESRTKWDKTESGDGQRRGEPCNLVSPPSNERGNALDPEIVEARAKMMDVYCIKESVADDLIYFRVIVYRSVFFISYIKNNEIHIYCKNSFFQPQM